MIRLLIVDDSALMRRVLDETFRGEADFEIAFARDGIEAIAQLHTFLPDVITLDMQMPRMDGLACLDRIMIERPCPVVVLSSVTTEGAAATLAALELGAVDFLPKPAGTVSLAMDALGPAIVAKVRTAATARVRRARRLTERLRARRMPAAQVAAVAVGIPDAGEDLPGLVVIGTSTGGPTALEVVLGVLPADFPWPVLIAQHLPAAFTASLASRLDTLCALSVSEVARPTLIRPGHVYIARGDADMLVSLREGRAIALPVPESDSFRWHPSVERLMRSAASCIDPRRLIGVLMTGMGNDGAPAMTALREAGGRTMAEAEESAVIWGMPGELVRAGGADHVVLLDDIAATLVKLVGRP